MSLLTHGSDLRLSPTLGPICTATGLSPRQALASVASEGFAAVQLDATWPGLRPRELDRSARRDLQASAVRDGLMISGIDFFIPTDHFRDAAHVDRAAAALQGACSLAADLGRVPVSLALPLNDAEPGLIDLILATADGLGVTLAIHDEADFEYARDWLAGHDRPVVGAGVDPASLLIRRLDPASSAQSLGDAWCVARLSDASRGQADGGRCVVGRGDLDLSAYRISADLATTRRGPVVLDLRGVASPIQAMREADAAWQNAAERF
ncbi:MAG: hypothetical protein ACPGYV_10070 [Phycisphaeraceae bacterium]